MCEDLLPLEDLWDEPEKLARHVKDNRRDCSACSYKIPPADATWLDGSPMSINYCGGCGRPVEEVTTGG